MPNLEIYQLIHLSVPQKKPEQQQQQQLTTKKRNYILCVMIWLYIETKGFHQIHLPYFS